jgi:hypothetical protein
MTCSLATCNYMYIITPTLKMEAMHSSAMLVATDNTTRRYNPDEHGPHFHRCENLKPHVYYTKLLHELWIKYVNNKQSIGILQPFKWRMVVSTLSETSNYSYSYLNSGIRNDKLWRHTYLLLKMADFCDTALCSPVETGRRFRGVYSLHHQ